MNYKPSLTRYAMLAIGTITLLFIGILYAWSILKAPLSDEFRWSSSALALNFTLTMCCFCVGGSVAGFVQKKIGFKRTLLLAAFMTCAGFCLTGKLSGNHIYMLYLCYGLLGGLGIGMSYNLIVSSVNAWFPDKKGLCSGILMMGFGSSALVLGNLAQAAFAANSLGWRWFYTRLGIVLGAILLLASLCLRYPGIAAQHQNDGKSDNADSYTMREMVRTSLFWRAFLCIAFLAAVGNTVISFAKDLTMSVGANPQTSASLVGILSICNGLGRIFTGALFDRIGRKKTMLAANSMAIIAAGTTLAAVVLASMPLCIVGLCVTGFSYGSCPTITSAFTAERFGGKHFSANFSIMNYNLMLASFIATGSNLLLASTGSYIVPFSLLLALSIAAFMLNINLR